jgi:hypothetical protein
MIWLAKWFAFSKCLGFAAASNTWIEAANVRGLEQNDRKQVVLTHFSMGIAPRCLTNLMIWRCVNPFMDDQMSNSKKIHVANTV